MLKELLKEKTILCMNSFLFSTFSFAVSKKMISFAVAIKNDGLQS